MPVWNSRENLKLKLRCCWLGAAGLMTGSVGPKTRGRGVCWSSVAERSSTGFGAEGCVVVRSGDGALELGWLFDRPFELVPIMLRRNPRKPPLGGSTSIVELALDSGRLSSSTTDESVEKRLLFESSDVGVGGTIPSKDRNEPAGFTCVSVRMIRSRLLGAGLQGFVGGRGVLLSVACSRSHR